jgi:archaeal flagellar protein FlaJ
MSSSKSLTAPNKKASSKRTKRKIPKPDHELLGFDLLFQLAHMSAVAAAGVSRAKIMSMAATLSTSTAHYFDDVDQVATAMNYPYAEAARVVGQKVEEPEIRGFLLRFASALNTGEPEADFLAVEAAIQGEAYGNVYERALETLKKWTDAFTALIVSASLIIVVATVSTMIFDLGMTFVLGLVVAMVGISFLGVWIIYRAVPREIRTIPGPGGDRTQASVKKILTMTMPVGLALTAVATLVSIPLGWVMIGLGVLMLPVGVMARRLDNRVNLYDQDIATFLRVLGVTVSSIGTTAVVALGRIDMRSMPSLVEPVRRLRTRLIARVDPVQSWQRFIDETGSELVARSVRVYLDGTNLGGDADEVGRRASLLGSKMNQLRDKRKLVSSSFTYLSLAMHVVIGFLLIFIVEVVSGFNELVASAGVNTPGGPGAALGSVLAFNGENLAMLRNSMVPVLLALGIVNALAPKVAEGGYSLTLMYYLGLTSILGGGAMVVAPILARVIFGQAASV